MDSILIGGKERPVNVGWGTLKDFGKQTGRSFSQVFSVEDLGFDDIEKLLFVSLKWGAKREGQDFDVKIADVQGWLNDDMLVVVKFMEIFGESVTAALDEKNLPAPEAGQ